MPTPHVAALESVASRPLCPPEASRATATATATATALQIHDTTPPSPPVADCASKAARPAVDAPSRDTPTPTTAADESADEPLLSPPFPARRFLPITSSSLLRPGSRFRGSQTSDRQRYDVEVEIKHVDMTEAFMCGYLRIKGLTEDHPSLTTYFESEIIGSHYTFVTQHPEWGSNEKVDRQHWARFPAYKALAKHTPRPDSLTRFWAQKEHLFMRWKEYFLVPDHRVRTINGASFEGFYYICFNQVQGSIDGIYFHAKSEKFQKLQLQHVLDFGCEGAVEFR